MSPDFSSMYHFSFFCINKISKYGLHPKLLITNIIAGSFFCIKHFEFLFLCGGVELNPGDNFTFMQWNCNSLRAHDYTRLSLIQAYNSIHKLNLIAITETALDNKISDKEI